MYQLPLNAGHNMDYHMSAAGAFTGRKTVYDLPPEEIPVTVNEYRL